jgi:hypothetical protein
MPVFIARNGHPPAEETRVARGMRGTSSEAHHEYIAMASHVVLCCMHMRVSECVCGHVSTWRRRAGHVSLQLLELRRRGIDDARMRIRHRGVAGTHRERGGWKERRMGEGGRGRCRSRGAAEGVRAHRARHTVASVPLHARVSSLPPLCCLICSPCMCRLSCHAARVRLTCARVVSRELCGREQRGRKRQHSESAIQSTQLQTIKPNTSTTTHFHLGLIQ